MNIKTFVLFIFTFNLRFNVVARNTEMMKMEILDSIIGPGYNIRMRPAGTRDGGDGPLNVKVNVYIRSIINIDDVDMSFRVQIILRQMWNDSRLMYDDLNGRVKYVSLNDMHKIWVPDLFIGNEINAQFHDSITPNVLLRIYPNGNVLTSLRVTLKLSCPMNLRNFPMDRQTCSIVIASYGHTVDDLTLSWKENDPVQVMKSIILPEYTLKNLLTAYCVSRTNTGEYSCLRIDLTFKRETQGYFIMVYIPTYMMVIMSWVSFWISQKAALIRAVVSLSSLLALGSHIAFVNGMNLPFVSYIKAIDIWTGMCLTFTFGAFFEFVIVHCMWLRKQRLNACNDFEMKQLVSAENTTHAHVKEKSNRVRRYWNRSDWSHRIDLLCRICYPIAFGIFNACYWAIYLKSDED